MAAKWTYPNTSTLSISNAYDSSGYIINDNNSGTPAENKTVSFKGYKTPEDDEDANESSSTFKVMTEIIYGLFGLDSGLQWNTAYANAKAEIDGEFE